MNFYLILFSHSILFNPLNITPSSEYNTISILVTQSASEEGIEDAISKGVAWLASQQFLDGSWGVIFPKSTIYSFFAHKTARSCL
ncbi:MAG: hypothetical protein ACXAC2_03760 [Candidatus Kariarchaeaceae archaeon]